MVMVVIGKILPVFAVLVAPILAVVLIRIPIPLAIGLILIPSVLPVCPSSRHAIAQIGLAILNGLRAIRGAILNAGSLVR